MRKLTAQLYSLIFLLGLLVLSACGDKPAHLQTSGFAVRAPDSDISFDDYLDSTRAQLANALSVVYERAGPSPFGDDYPLERTLQMRAPYEIREAPLCGTGEPRTGYLLIHGLTDSPYLLSAVARSLAGRSPCSVVRSVLLPGHGTVPGDSLKVHRDEWRQITRYGVDSFRGRVNELYLVGYSAGATLAVEYADQNRDDSFLAGLVLMSPAMALPDPNVRFAPYVRWFMDWLGTERERDAAKYETLAINAGAEFYLLVRELGWRQMQALELPVFMVVSGVDATVDVSAAADFFCEKAPRNRRHLLWYSSANDASEQLTNCGGISVESIVDTEHRIVSVSHVGITIPGNDPHYGRDAGYRQCLHYSAVAERFEQCLADDIETVYGERSLLLDGLYDGRLMRRATFNPAFASMMQRVDCFLADTCY
ncbi:MAG: alpha/beta fold hydrolase [Pseudohongiella sp.]|nr:alpha/beta fold hydrolase [Pseudohongiella sp.]